MSSVVLTTPSRHRLARLVLRVPQTVAATLANWANRHRSRHDLRNLDPHMLKDIGIDWAEARTEAEKPFWRA